MIPTRLFQLPTKEELINVPRIGDVVRPLDLCEDIDEVSLEPQPYDIGPRVGPSKLTDLQLNDETNEIEDSLVIYSGKEGESYVETRIRLYQNLKTKTSMSIPPDPDSAVQVIKRSHHQVFQWLRCCYAWIETLPLESNGWIIEEEDSKPIVKPLWFTGSQLPPSAVNKKNKKKPRAAVTSGNIADDETDDDNSDKSPKHKKQKRLSINEREGHNTKALEITAEVHKDEDFVSGGGQAFRRWSRSLATADQDADQESEGIDAPCTADSSIMDADSWEEWEEFDFLSTDDDSADEWLP